MFIGLFGVYLANRGDDDAETDSTEIDAGEPGDTTDDSTDSDDDDETETAWRPSAPEPGASIDGPTECPAADGSSARVTAFSEAPPMCIDPSKTYTAEIETNLGAFTMALDAERAPETVNNFVVLARYHFYDDVAFHRIIPDFVIQGGDAVGAPLGTGDPGYSIDDELPAEGEYEVGSVAMANSGPNTSGSQFFVVTGPDGASLPPSYSLFGSVTDGFDVVEAIEALPTDPGDAPTEKIVISSVTITES